MNNTAASPGRTCCRPEKGGGAGKSFVVPPEQLVAADVDWLVVCPCGFRIPQAKREMRTMVEAPWW